MTIHSDLETADRLVDEGNSAEAMALVLNFLENIFPRLEDSIFKINSHYKAGCLLTDIGAYQMRLDIIEKGLAIIQVQRYEKYYSKSSFQYNLGNAKKAIFDHRRHSNNDYSAENLQTVIEAKNHYWRSLKQLSDHDEDMKDQLLVNIANALNCTGRVTEALFFYSQALSINPDRFEAHASKVTALELLNDLSDRFTPQMLFSMSHHLRKAIRLATPYGSKDFLRTKLKYIREILKRMGFKFTQDDRRHRFEYVLDDTSYGDLASFCLKRGLFLSQHSNYCSCSAGRNDILADKSETLKIIKNRSLRSAVNIKHIFDRIIVDFHIGRSLLYQATTSNLEFFPTLTPDLSLISGFRYIYGVFDKIAVGLMLCHNIKFHAAESVLFESFWRNYPTIKNAVFSEGNFNLIALYSIATDLQSKTGELRFFKEYRNILEHSTLILTKSSIFETASGPIKKVSREQLLKDLDSLTRIARSAIFSLFLYLKNQARTLAE